jgi:hypothetical protein
MLMAVFLLELLNWLASKVETERQRRGICQPGASAKRSGARRPWLQ